jgi:hypothetical protein
MAVFRNSVVYTPENDPDIVCSPIPYEYSLRTTDNNGKEYGFRFRVYANGVRLADLLADNPNYVFPKERIPQLKKLIQNLLSTKAIAGGQYAYLPGEDDCTHYDRIRSF